MAQVSSQARMLTSDEIGRLDPELLRHSYRISGEVVEVRVGGFYSVVQLESLLRDLRCLQQALDTGAILL